MADSYNPFLDKIAIVTGASDGIGRSTALALARRGAHIGLAARRTALLEGVAEEVRNIGKEALVLTTDVTDQNQVNHMVDCVIQRWGRVDILVSNAGEYIRTYIDTLTIEHLQRSLAVNFYGGMYAILAVLPHMQKRGRGHIVVVTSMDGKIGLPKDAPYVAAKFAMTGFAEVLRQELKPMGIYVSNVLPGRVDTPMIQDLKVPRISPKIPPEAVARAVLQAIEKRKPEVMVPPMAIIFHYTHALSPRLSDWFIRFLHLEGWED
jgi:NAD(P)-dependent dehydrogenase (short-subunit alcohol dehydrogenase family)